MCSAAGRGDEHSASRGPEDAVPQDQDGRHQLDAVRGNPAHPQPGVHVTSLPEHLLRGLNNLAWDLTIMEAVRLGHIQFMSWPFNCLWQNCYKMPNLLY